MGKRSVYKCAFSKCGCLHDSDMVPAEEAVKDGTRYYHPDCLALKRKVAGIKDTFVTEVNPLLTKKDISSLYGAIYNLVFKKNVDIDFIKFALDYYIKYKPGALKFPGGLFYIIQNRDVNSAYDKKKEIELQRQVKTELEKNKFDNVIDDFEFDLPETSSYKATKKTFVDILKG